ncbi:MAG TPA: RND transporter [Treponema sp.]|nr:RND transporter [Treponema sp.]
MKKKSGGGIFLLFLLLAGAAGGGLYYAYTHKLLPSVGVTDDTVTYMVKKEVYENCIEVAGTVSAAHEQTLQALSSGTVVAVYVSQGDRVRKGDVILQLDDTQQQYDLAKHDYDMQTTRITGSSKQVKLKETERLSLLQKIAERKVTATFDGVIAAISASVGDSLDAKDSVGSLVDLSYLTATVEIAETDVSKLQVGQPVEFSFPAAGKETVMGYVTGWPAIGEVTSRGATVVKATLRIDEYPESILPNFSFSGKIQIAPAETFLLVNRLAVGREDGVSFVVDARSGLRSEVKVVPYDVDYVKIVSGSVSEGAVLAAQSGGERSGKNAGRAASSARDKTTGDSRARNEGGFPGGGAGGPPPGRM